MKTFPASQLSAKVLQSLIGSTRVLTSHKSEWFAVYMDMSAGKP